MREVVQGAAAARRPTISPKCHTLQTPQVRDAAAWAASAVEQHRRMAVLAVAAVWVVTNSSLL